MGLPGHLGLVAGKADVGRSKLANAQTMFFHLRQGSSWGHQHIAWLQEPLYKYYGHTWSSTTTLELVLKPRMVPTRSGSLEQCPKGS